MNTNTTPLFYKEYAGNDFIRHPYVGEYSPNNMRWMMHTLNERIFDSLYSWPLPENGVMNWREPPLPITHYIIFDFDCSWDIELARNNAAHFVRFLEAAYDVDPNVLGLYYSGHKGFHVVLPMGLLSNNPDVHTHGVTGLSPDMIKTFALQLGVGFEHFDTSTFDMRRLFRVPYAPHAATGRVKRPVSLASLLYKPTAEIIREQSSEWPETWEMPEFNARLHELMLNVSAMIKPEERIVRSTISEIFEPARVGQRNNKATQLVGLLTKQISDITLVREIVRMWNRQNRQPLGEAELEDIISGVHGRYRARHKSTIAEVQRERTTEF